MLNRIALCEERCEGAPVGMGGGSGAPFLGFLTTLLFLGQSLFGFLTMRLLSHQRFPVKITGLFSLGHPSVRRFGLLRRDKPLVSVA